MPALELKSLLKSILLVDVRSLEEREISIIPGSISKEEFETRRRADPTFSRDRAIVVYCTIGYRSAIYAQALIKDGIRVKNLKGGVLAWAAEQLEFKTMSGAPTKKIHVYGKRWNILPENYEPVW